MLSYVLVFPAGNMDAGRAPAVELLSQQCVQFYDVGVVANSPLLYWMQGCCHETRDEGIKTGDFLLLYIVSMAFMVH